MIRKIIFITYLLLFMLVCLWINQLIHGDMPYIDQWSRKFVSQIADTPLYIFFSRITQFGGRKFLIPFTITMSFVLFFMYKSLLPAIFFGISTYGGHMLNVVMKELVARERPSISIPLGAEGYSFPSGHAMNAIICYGILTYFITKKIRSKFIRIVLWIIATIVIILVGISRYVANVHFITDVIAGFFFGSLYVFSLVYLFHRITRFSK